MAYEKWYRNKRVFKVNGLRIFVGDLRQLLQAKENSNREKDRKFLALYKLQLKDLLKARV